MSANDAKVPVVKVCAWAYRDSWIAALTMPLTFAAALLICLAEAAVVDRTQYDSRLLNLIVNAAAAIVVSFLLTPFLIAVHRFILLGERSSAYRLDVRSPRFWKFFVYSALLDILLQGAAASDLLFRAGTGAAAVFPLFLMLGVLVISIRVILLFPAIAVDQVSARWHNALLASRGSFWRITAICVLLPLPLLPVVIWWAVVHYDNATETFTDSQGWGIVLFIGFANFFIRTVLIAAASHLFRGLGDRLRDDSNPASSRVGS